MTTEQSIRIGSGSSALAQAQANRVVKLIQEASGAPAQLAQLPLDLSQDTAFDAVAAMRAALEANVIDVAVHALKDVPPVTHPGLVMFTPERESAQEALCSTHGVPLDFLSAGDRIGADSPIRIEQLRALRPDLAVVEIDGDIKSQLTRIDLAQSAISNAEPLDAVILGAAALNRIGESHRVSERIPFSAILPAPGQGAIAIEVRAEFEGENPGLFSALRSIHHQPTFLATAAERALLGALLFHDIHIVGAYAHLSMGSLKLQATAVKKPRSEQAADSDQATDSARAQSVSSQATAQVRTEQEAIQVGQDLARSLVAALES